MTELLVSLGVLAVLLALLLPAVQQSRLAAHSMQCKNNLRQSGIAMHHFQEQHGVFPAFDYARELLPYVEQRALMDKIADMGFVHGSLEDVAGDVHFYGAATPIFSCPSDSAQSIAGDRAISYRLNAGTGFGGHEDGFRRKHTPIKPADVTDGLSQTAAFSERLLYRGKERDVPDVGAFTPTSDQKRRRMATTDAYRGAGQMDKFADACRDNATWFGGDAGFICTVLSRGCSGFDYNHIMTPNQNSCFNGVPDVDFQYQQYAAHAASSLHAGGVHVLFGDGAVQFISDSIDRQVWRALGTRAGQEAYALTAF